MKLGEIVDKKTFLNEFARLTDLKLGSVKGNEKLSDISGWNSLSVVTFVVFVLKNFGVEISAADLAKIQTVDELMDLFGDRIAD